VALFHVHDLDNTGTALRAKLNDMKFRKSRKRRRKSAALKRLATSSIEMAYGK
jgi:hypothetical protein